MAGGPVFPIALAYPSNGRVYPGLWIGATNNKQESGHNVIASLDADSVAEFRFRMPPIIPSGTFTLRIAFKANAVSGDIKFDVAWVAIAGDGGNSDTATYSAEGTQTVTWTTGDDDDYVEFTLTLDAATAPTAGQIVALELRFQTTSWTLAQTLFFLEPELIWV